MIPVFLAVIHSRMYYNLFKIIFLVVDNLMNCWQAADGIHFC